MTFASVKSILKIVDADDARVDGASETARLFLPAVERRIELVRRGVTVVRRNPLRAPARMKRFVRVS